MNAEVSPEDTLGIVPVHGQALGKISYMTNKKL